MKKGNKWIWVLIPVMLSAGCGLANKKNDATTPSVSAGGTGALAVSSAVAGVTFVYGLVSGITSAKPSAGKLNAGVIASVFTPPANYNCESGQINFIGLTGTAVNCVENGGTVTANGTTIVLTPDLLAPTVNCNSNDLPTGLAATINGPVSIGGVDFTFTGLGMVFSNITYDGNCKMVGFDILITGAIGNSSLDVTVNFDAGGVLFNVAINGNQAEVTANGNASVHTPCLDGSFAMNTTQTIIVPDGETCPTSGSVALSGGLSGVVTYPTDCTNPACVLGL